MAQGREADNNYIVLFGTRISRDTAIYALGTSVIFPVGLATVAVLTRFLAPADYGRLAVLYVFASLLTTLYNAGSLQGVLSSVFRGAADDVEVDAASAPVTKGSKRRVLGTGLSLTALIAAVGTAALCVAAEPFGRVLLNDPGHATEVRWAAASAGLGAVWRLIINVFRYERRPLLFSVLNATRPVFALACAVPFVAAGLGVPGALAGTTVGTALGLAICLVMARRSYAPAFDLGDSGRIMVAGLSFLPVIVGLWMLHNADVLLLSRFAPDGEVGLYRLADRVALFISYFVSAFLMAWSPLEATSLLRATYERYGRPAVRATLVTAYLVSSLVILLAMAVSADLLVDIAAPSYAAAAPLIVPIGLGFVGYGGFIVLVRAAQIPHRMRAYGAAAVGAAVLFGVLAVVLIPPLGGYGAALSTVGATSAAIAVFMVLIVRSRDSIPFEYRRMGTALALSAACYAAIRWSAAAASAWRVEAELAAFTAYLVLLVFADVVPRSHLAALLAMARGLLPRRRGRGELIDRLATLAPSDRVVVEAVARGSVRATPESEVALVRALRALAGPSAPSDRDPAIGAYLLSTAPAADRDAMAERLWQSGVEPGDLHALESTLEQLRRVPRRAWAGKPAGTPGIAVDR